MSGIGDASDGTNRIGRAFAYLFKNGTFLLGVVTLTVGDLFLGQNFFQTLLGDVDGTPLFDNVWLSVISPRSLTATLISAMFSAVQMIGINMIVRGVKWKTLTEPGYKLGYVLVWMFFLVDAYFNFGGAAQLLGGVKEGTVLPENINQVTIMGSSAMAAMGSFGALFLYMYLRVGESSNNGDDEGGFNLRNMRNPFRSAPANTEVAA